MSRYSFRHTVPAPPAAVWDLVADHEGMAGWTPVRDVRLEREGAPERDGVGAVRALHLAWPPIRERVTAFDAPRRLAYEAVSGVPARDYRGEVVLTPAGTGTEITWTIAFTPLLPGTGIALATVIRGAAALLARRARTLPAG